MDIFISLVGLGLIIIAIINTIYSHVYKVVNMPSAPQTRKAIISDIEGQFGDCTNLQIIDLGSGWGGLCHKLSRHFPKAVIHGVEISPIPFMFSKCVAFLNPFHHYTITRHNLFEIDLSQYDIIICYLSFYHMDQFENHVIQRCKKGTILYSQGFPLKSIDADRVIEIPLSIEKKLYRYKL